MWGVVLKTAVGCMQRAPRGWQLLRAVMRLLLTFLELLRDNAHPPSMVVLSYNYLLPVTVKSSQKEERSIIYKLQHFCICNKFTVVNTRHHHARHPQLLHATSWSLLSMMLLLVAGYSFIVNKISSSMSSLLLFVVKSTDDVATRRTAPRHLLIVCYPRHHALQKLPSGEAKPIASRRSTASTAL